MLRFVFFRRIAHRISMEPMISCSNPGVCSFFVLVIKILFQYAKKPSAWEPAAFLVFYQNIH